MYTQLQFLAEHIQVYTHVASIPLYTYSFNSFLNTYKSYMYIVSVAYTQ